MSRVKESPAFAATGEEAYGALDRVLLCLIVTLGFVTDLYLSLLHRAVT